VEKRLADKQAAAEAHRKQMEGIKDPTQLTTAMQQHFQMTEEILALLLERRKLMAAQAPTGSASAGAGSGTQSGGRQGMRMMEHGMRQMQQGKEMMQKEMGDMQGGGRQGMRMMEHGMGQMQQGKEMMQKEMGGMQGSNPPESGVQGSGTTQQGMSGMSGSSMPGHPATGTQSAPTASSSDMEQMMQRIAEHSAYMETIKDQPLLTQEMLRHQKMLDQMLQLMQ
jgi:hypothetical protein